MNKKNAVLLVMFALCVLPLAGCAAGPNSAIDTAAANGSTAGFWLGLWHGIISPITFIISLFSKNVNFYEIHNNGGWYNFGFILGIGAAFGGGGKAATKK